MASANLRNGPGTTFWTSAEVPSFLNHDSHDNDTDLFFSSDFSSEKKEDSDGRTRNDCTEADDGGTGGVISGSDPLCELEAILISQLEAINDDIDAERVHQLPCVRNLDVSNEFPVELLGSPWRGAEDMPFLDDSTSTTVAPSPTGSTSSTLVVGAPTWPSTTESEMDRPPVTSTIVRKRRSLVEDNEVGQPAAKLLRRSATLDQEQDTSLSVDTHSPIPTTAVSVPWRGLPRPKDCVGLRGHTVTTTLQNTVDPSIHKQTETHSLWGSTPVSTSSLSPPSPHLQTPPNQYVTQHPFAPQLALPTYYNMCPNVTPFSDESIPAAVGTHGHHLQSVLPAHTIPRTSYTYPSYLARGIEETGILHPQFQHSFQFSSPNMANGIHSAMNAAQRYPLPQTIVPAVAESPQFVAGSSSPPTFVRLPQSNEVCNWDIGSGSLCNHRLDGSKQETRNHIKGHIGAASSKAWEETDVQCRWWNCGKNVKALSLKRHILGKHLGATRVKCNDCNQIYVREETFRRHRERCPGKRLSSTE
ncbi:hypothetical protein L218DRAFT_997940 [Marasmius fiardii PR-910]|nr:hypothetical protein L218DRAFT_997940 [Marasmius fiardii PR-910]